MSSAPRPTVEDLAARFPSPIEALEFLAVLRGLKPCLRYACHRGREQSFLDFWRKYGLIAIKADFAVVRDDNDSFVNKGRLTSAGDPAATYSLFYVSREPAIAEQARDAESRGDYDAFGALMGYPACCRAFFVREAPARDDQDFTIPIVAAAGDEVYPFVNNVLRRNEGLGLIFHFPCSFACAESAKIGYRLFEILKELHAEGADAIRAELCKPVNRGKIIKFG